MGGRWSLKSPGSAGRNPRRCSQAGSRSERPPTIYVCAAHCCLISPPARVRTLNSGKAGCPHVRLSVRPFACDHGLALPAPATAGAGLRRGVGVRFSRVGRGDEGRTPCSPAQRKSRARAPREPGLSPSQSPHQRSQNSGPRAPAAPEPLPVSPAGAALRGSLGRGV